MGPGGIATIIAAWSHGSIDGVNGVPSNYNWLNINLNL